MIITRGGSQMYLSAEQMALANQAVVETFENTSIAWQAIPHWLTGDPGQLTVRADVIANQAAPNLPLNPKYRDFTISLTKAIAPTPEALLAQVVARTAELAQHVDGIVFPTLKSGAPTTIDAGDMTLDKLFDALISARAKVEDAGYRAPSCLFTNTEGLKRLNYLLSGFPATDGLLAAANINALYRTECLSEDAAANSKVRMVLLGRRQLIPNRGGADSSPGEEPVDVAVSVAPSLEVVGEAPGDKNEIALTVRIRFATRVKDANGIVGIINPV